MKAAKLMKITAGLTKYSLVTVLLSAGLGIACSAQAPNNVPGPRPNASLYATQNPGPAAAPDLASIAASTEDTGNSPQMQAAFDRVTKAKADLDTAHKRLSASKAIVKAADAEFKAAKADQQALALQTQARELADASGMTQPAATTTTPTPPAQGQPAGNDQNGDGQSFDFSGGSAPAPYTTVPTPGK